MTFPANFGPIAGRTRAVEKFVFSETFSTDTTLTSSYHLYNRAVAAGWDEQTPLEASLTIESGVLLGADDTNTLIDRTGSEFPSGCTWFITNRGRIQGRGGQGGGASCSFESALPGNAGSSALRHQGVIDVTVDNAGGELAGGGGGGGAATDNNEAGTGGGGAGEPGGAGGGDTDCGTTHVGSSGTLNSGGAGGSSSNVTAGDGGNPGLSGEAGTGGSVDNGAGGSPGNSVVGYSNITWIDEGTLTGPTSG